MTVVEITCDMPESVPPSTDTADLSTPAIPSVGPALNERQRASAPALLRAIQPDIRHAVLQVVGILVGAAVVGAVLHWMIGAKHPTASWLLMVLLGVAALAAGCWGAIRRWHDYTLPLRLLQDLLPKVRLGEVPIDELSSVRGGLTPIIPGIQSLLTELRNERKQNAVLQEEIRQRVQSRTDALQRKIGTLQQQATRDGLTGLNNRRSLDHHLPVLIQQARQQGVDLCVMMIDVDYFKSLNDTLGHAAGDELLKQIAQIIKSSIRETDLACRCGGDEFVVVLPGAPLDIASRLAGRIRSLVDEIGKTLRVPKPPRLSIGLAGLQHTNADSAQELLALADKSLYEIKAARPGSSRAA